jgi:hypothetical protein
LNGIDRRGGATLGLGRRDVGGRGYQSARITK